MACEIRKKRTNILVYLKLSSSNEVEKIKETPIMFHSILDWFVEFIRFRISRSWKNHFSFRDCLNEPDTNFEDFRRNSKSEFLICWGHLTKLWDNFIHCYVKWGQIHINKIYLMQSPGFRRLSIVWKIREKIKSFNSKVLFRGTSRTLQVPPLPGLRTISSLKQPHAPHRFRHRSYSISNYSISYRRYSMWRSWRKGFLSSMSDDLSFRFGKS